MCQNIQCFPSKERLRVHGKRKFMGATRSRSTWPHKKVMMKRGKSCSGSFITITSSCSVWSTPGWPRSSSARIIFWPEPLYDSLMVGSRAKYSPGPRACPDRRDGSKPSSQILLHAWREQKVRKRELNSKTRMKKDNETVLILVISTSFSRSSHFPGLFLWF